MNQLNSKKGFTLAEILITLGIIGVVAAMTIPTILNNIQDAQFKTAAKKSYSVTSAAVNKMKDDEGGSFSNYIGNGSSFKPIFIKYFSVIKDCNLSDCVPSSYTSTQYTSLSGDPADTSIGAEGQFVTADGIFFNIQNSVSLPETITIVVDVNGYQNKPNVYGKDTFAFQIINDTLVPMGANNTVYTVSANYCIKTVSRSRQGFGCMANVMQGIDY